MHARVSRLVIEWLCSLRVACCSAIPETDALLYARNDTVMESMFKTFKLLLLGDGDVGVSSHGVNLCHDSDTAV